MNPTTRHEYATISSSSSRWLLFVVDVVLVLLLQIGYAGVKGNTPATENAM